MAERLMHVPGGDATQPLSRDASVEDSAETQQSSHTSRSGPEVKNGSTSSAKAGAPERLR